MSEKLLDTCSDQEFFKTLESFVKFKVPLKIQNILTMNSFNNAYAMSKFNEASIQEVENFMRTDFKGYMIVDAQSTADYLGIFSNDQKQFKFLSGEKIILRGIAEHCQTVYPQKISPHLVSPAQIVSNHSVPPNEILDDSFNGPTKNIFNVVGSRMITVFNDAKRVTLSAWSWPSREVAAEMAHKFEVSGNAIFDSPINFNLQYVTPKSHKEFLDCIVKTDIENVKLCLRQSLAVSLRLDGSTDRTQVHNVYVMAHIVKADATVSTLFIGFGVPASGDSDDYFQCLKDVTTKILPWTEFFKLVTSAVTDGESLNTGRLNGLIAKLKQERSNFIAPQLPLLYIWCVPHRINLAWKSVCKIATIANTIKHCQQLSRYFHSSGVRTKALHDVATTPANNLHKPLRYPSYFEVRWIEYVSKLLDVVLRNWRAAAKYFELKNLSARMKVWLQYDRLHFISFLADVLSIVTKFQKACQSDDISIVDVFSLKTKCTESLERCKNGSLHDGWEQLFLQNVVTNNNSFFFYGIKLLKSSTSNRRAFSFKTNIRNQIIRSLINHLNIRIDSDAVLHTTLKPLAKISSSMPQHDIKLCYLLIAPDLDENSFSNEYTTAAELLKGYNCETPLASLKMLQKIAPDQLKTIKYALARVIAMKPHSADVERLISVYNKFKDTDRASLSPSTLWNYLYINVNMSSLEAFDPTAAVQYWMNQKRRRSHSSETRHRQEWFRGVLTEGRRPERLLHRKHEF